MSSRVNHLRDELALESVTNIEFEQSSRRNIEFLTGQVKTLKEAFNTLTETLLQELDKNSSAVRGEQRRLDERVGDFEKKVMREINDAVQRQHEKTQQGQLEIQRQFREEHQDLQKLQEKQQEKQVELSRQQERHAEQHQELHKQYERQQERQLELQKYFDKQQDSQQELQKDYERHQERQLQVERKTDLLVRDMDKSQEQQQHVEKQQLEIERRVDPIARDVETILGVVPNIEDTMHKANAHFQERLGAVTHDLSKVNDAVTLDWGKVSNLVERLDGKVRTLEGDLQGKVRTLEGDLRDKFEQQNLNFQRSITRQLESMSRVLLETERHSTLGPLGAAPPLVDSLCRGSGSASGGGTCGGMESSLLRGGANTEASLFGGTSLGQRHVDFNFSGLDPLNRHGAGSLHGSRLA